MPLTVWDQARTEWSMSVAKLHVKVSSMVSCARKILCLGSQRGGVATTACLVRVSVPEVGSLMVSQRQSKVATATLSLLRQSPAG